MSILTELCTLLLLSDPAMNSLLNLLKLMGILISGTATVLATAKETKTPDKQHLTREGKAILVLGIGGLLIASGAQGVEWHLASTRNQDEVMKNHALLVEIRRSVTRFNDISMNVGFTLDPDQELVKGYVRQLNERIGGLDSEPHPVGKVLGGLKVVSRVEGSFPFNEIIKLPVGSEALPNPANDKNAKALLGLTLPTVAIFRKPIDPVSYVTLFPGNNQQPDLTLRASGGLVEGLIVRDQNILDNDGNNRMDLSISRRQMVIEPDTWNASLNTESMEDLNGAQAIVSLGFLDTAETLWKAHPPAITLFINHHGITLSPLKAVSSKDGRWTCYVYNFPKDFVP